MKLPDRFRREEERSFRWWLKKERKRGGEYKEAAMVAEFSVPRLLVTVYPQLTMKEIYEMAWCDVVLRVDLAANHIDNMKNTSNINDINYPNYIRNEEVP